jgi:hypothetical protein
MTQNIPLDLHIGAKERGGQSRRSLQQKGADIAASIIRTYILAVVVVGILIITLNDVRIPTWNSVSSSSFKDGANHERIALVVPKDSCHDVKVVVVVAIYALESTLY